MLCALQKMGENAIAPAESDQVAVAGRAADEVPVTGFGDFDRRLSESQAPDSISTQRRIVKSCLSVFARYGRSSK
jgi:hypothetical protein